MATSTFFSGFNKPVENKSLILIVNDIINGKYSADIQRIRTCIAECDTEKADHLKKNLPAFTPSGTYEGGRKAELLKQYSGFVHLDFDKLTTDQLNGSFHSISQIPYTFACFRSPSGNGLKVLVEVSTSAEHHDIAYRQVQEYYEKALGIMTDPKCKDITRLCFVSHDPAAYKNINNKKFIVQLPKAQDQPPAISLSKESPSLSDASLDPTSQSSSASHPSPILGEGTGVRYISPDLASQSILANHPSPNNKEIRFPSHPGEGARRADEVGVGTGVTPNSLFNDCLNFTSQKEQYYEGNRNNFIYLLACNCNRKGLPESETLEQSLSAFDLSDKEIRAAVHSAYHNHYAEFAIIADSATVQNSQPVEQEESLEDFLKTTPKIPASLFSSLPLLLKSGAEAFSDERERDVFLTGAIAILSGCMPGVKGIYAQQIVYPNLFAFVIAPAASGKGALKFSKMLADKRHDLLLKQSRDEQLNFDADLNQFKASQKSRKKGDPPEDPPTPPPFKVVYIPANSSYAKILAHLEMNQGEGIICETEADTMGNVLKQEWGGYSDMLRKAFHHERVSSSKKTNNEYIEVNEPRLSVALSGTPNQVTGLIASAEDGLFSRFIFYAFKADQLWHDVSPFASSINLTDHFNQLSQEVYDMFVFLEHYPTTIELTRFQWYQLNEICSHWLYEVTTFTGDDAGSIVKRLGLILYRISMIFTSLRKVENGDTSENVSCTDTDFDSAMQLADLYLRHSLLMFHNLPRQGEASVFKSGDNKRKFFEALPHDFKRAEATELGKKFSLSTRSVDALLKELNGRYLVQPQFGFYSKT